jgi:hypothetical protein
MSKHSAIDAEILRALQAGEKQLLGYLPFTSCQLSSDPSLPSDTAIFVRPKKNINQLYSIGAPHQKLAECVAIVRGDSVAITHLSRSLSTEWEALIALPPV